MKRWGVSCLSVVVSVVCTNVTLAASVVSTKALGEQRVLVIMCKFPDVSPSVPMQKMREKYLAKLDAYLKAASYGKTWLSGKMTDWHTLPRPVGDYRISPHNLSVDKDRVLRLIQDAVDLVDGDEDLSGYSMVFVSLGARRTDYGMMGLCGYPGMLGWQQRLPIRTREKGQEIRSGVAIFCEEAHVGVVFHDMAHIMGGVQEGKRVVPCLYDHDLQGKPGPFRNYSQFYMIHLGYFDPMSCHFIAYGIMPPDACAWTKMRLNWIDRSRIAEVPARTSATWRLAPLGAPGAQTQVIRIPLSETTYYLVENRSALGLDKNLPSHGVLIAYCDDDVYECRNGMSPVKLMVADPTVPELKGAPFTPEGKSQFKDDRRKASVRILGHRGEIYEVEVLNGKEGF